jgi:hypothetical protein
MGSGFTRRRFLGTVGACAAYLALTGAVGCAPRIWPLPSASTKTPKGVWAFRSRPDVGPAAAEVSTRARDTAPGYIFLAIKEGAGEHGPMILDDDDGRIVWFGKHPLARDFKMQYHRGRPVLTWWEGAVVEGHGEGEYVIFDDSYREVRRVRTGNAYTGDLHEFLITPQNTALLTNYAPETADLSSIGGPEDGPVWSGKVQEVDIETGEVLFEWRSLDHVGIEESYAGFPPDNPGFRYDYFHINSIDVDHDDNLLLCARNTWATYKIDRKSGEVLWRLGGKKSDFEMGEGTETAFQHDTRRHDDGTITIFDNGAHPKVHEQSRAVVLRLDEDNMKSTLLREYASPGKIVSTSQGNAQRLSNGNVLVGWGSAPFVSEFSGDGELLMNARFPPDCESYRAFRFPWKGDPADEPAVAVERRAEGTVAIYASWNGATEVERWEVVSGSGPTLMAPLGSVPREGFETAMLAQTTGPYVAVRALDGSGQILGTSTPVEI